MPTGRRLSGTGVPAHDGGSQWGSCYGTDVVAVCRESVVVPAKSNGMTANDMDSPDPPAKAITALLREAGSLSRRADKLGGTAAAVDDPTTQQLVAEACTSVEQLVHHLTVLERQLQRREKAAVRSRSLTAVSRSGHGRANTRSALSSTFA